MQRSLIIAVAATLLTWVSSGCTQELEEQNLALSQQVDSLTQEMNRLRKENTMLLAAVGKQIPVGFEVQIGAFYEFDLQAYQDEFVRLTEVESDGMNKYVLGRFSHYEDAEAFLRDVRLLGIQDAWIAGLVDGERRDIEVAQAAAESYYGDF